MKFFVIDDEKFALDRIVRELAIASPEAEIFPFTKPLDLLEFAKENYCDVAFLDVRMGGMTGVELANKLREIRPKTNVIFVTGYDEYAKEAMKMHASGYLMKPVTADDIKKELQDLRYPVQEKKDFLLYFKCFGKFEVFDKDKKPVVFERKKAQEMLAYLCYRRGEKCSTQELYDILFEDGKYDISARQRMYQTFVSSLYVTLKSVGAELVMVRNFGTITLDINKVECDWYNFLNSEIKDTKQYNGEFMLQYEWAEEENGNIIDLIDKYKK